MQNKLLNPMMMIYIFNYIDMASLIKFRNSLLC